MEKEKIIELIRSEVAKEFGEGRIKKIRSFGPYEGEDLNVIVYVEGIDEDKEGLKMHNKLFHKFLELGIDVPLDITRAKEDKEL
ncbi:MAG: hypothetical protein ACE5KT_03720 [Methanosarcinales archaeon]